MNTFVSKKAKLTYIQENSGTPDEVFPLLCPVREKDWLDGWDYSMIYTESGLIEEGCVFSTPHHGDTVTIWTVTKHDPEKYIVEFVRMTQGESVVKISIQLTARDTSTTSTQIVYEYTSLNEAQSLYLENELPGDFQKSMQWWEKAINHYLSTGKMLAK